MASSSGKPLLLLLLVLPVLCAGFNPDSPTDRRVLVLVDDLAIKSSHSTYFQSLTGIPLFLLLRSPNLCVYYKKKERFPRFRLIASNVGI